VDHIPDSWSHDGQNLSFTALKGNDASVWIYSLKDKKPTLFAQAPSKLVARPAFSPDDRWLAYQSNEVGRNQVWVQPFPATGARYPVVDGSLPSWSADGKELFYRGGSGLTAAIRITTRPNFAFSDPTPLPRGLLYTRANLSPRNFDITPDGKRFIGVIDANQTQTGSPAAPQIQLVINWFEDLKQRMSAR
jgi:Tol biopolymer transport system component